MGGIKLAPQVLVGKGDEIPDQSDKIKSIETATIRDRQYFDRGTPIMSEISELERRISAALDRIGAAVAQRPKGSDADLSAQLEAERTANAQLEARVAAIKERQETRIAGLEAEVAALQAALLSRDEELQTMRAVTQALRDSNTSLREANAAGLADAGLVDQALKAEIDALRAAASGTRAEIDDIIGALEPLLKEAGHA